MSIKTLIFDLGDVIVPLNYEKMHQAFSILGVSEAQEKFESDALKKLWKDYDNSLPTVEFRSRLRKELGIANHITDAQIDHAWNELYDPIPPERLEHLRSLREQGYELLLLSNNNEIHHQHAQKTFGAEFKEIFHEQFYSNKIGLAKPDVEIFKLVLGQRNPNEALFFDDKELNIRGAQAAGMHAKQFTVRESMSVVDEEIARINKAASKNKRAPNRYGFYAAAAIAAAVAARVLAQIISAGTKDAPKLK